VGTLGLVLLRVSSGTVLPIFIEIGSDLTEKEQKNKLAVFFETRCIRGAFKKFCNSTIKKNRNVTNYILLFNITPTEFNAFATFFWQTVNSTKIEIFSLPSNHSLSASLSASSSG